MGKIISLPHLITIIRVMKKVHFVALFPVSTTDIIRTISFKTEGGILWSLAVSCFYNEDVKP